MSDVEDRYGGDYDDHLTEKGRQQAALLAESLKNNGIQTIFSSPRFRANETAEIVSKVLNVLIQIVDDFRERNAYGTLTGMVKAEAKAQYPDVVEHLADYHYTAPEAESYEAFKTRVLAAFEAIKQSHFDTVAIITHAGPIRCLAREVLDKGEPDQIGDCAVMEL